MTAENLDRTQTPPERVDVLTNEIAERVAQLIRSVGKLAYVRAWIAPLR